MCKQALFSKMDHKGGGGQKFQKRKKNLTTWCMDDPNFEFPDQDHAFV